MSILVFHTGSLGDTLIAVPAMRAIRCHFKGANITLLTDLQKENGLVDPKEVLGEGVFVDSYMKYNAGHGKPAVWLKEMANLLTAIRKGRYEVLVYLIRSGRPLMSVIRDIVFFRLAGVRTFYGCRNMARLPDKRRSSPLPTVPHEADNLLERLQASGIDCSKAGAPSMDIGVGEAEERRVAQWLAALPPDDGRPWVGIGPGSKMPAKLWPAERYIEVVRKLIDRCDVWPVIFGGLGEKTLAESLVRAWGRGYVASGELGIRSGVFALKRCRFYLGNDTGTMHMAVAAGIPCVAVFSARDFPGLWYPYGKDHILIRKSVDCEGCMLEECIQRGGKCILDISVDEVYGACYEMARITIEKGCR